MRQTGRREFLKGLAAGALILGFHPGRRSWLTDAAAAQGTGAVGVPPLDGTLTTDPATCAALADDFGHIVHRTPYAVLRPGSTADIAKMVQFARANNLKIAGRGAGHCPFGQAQVDAGILVDLRAMNQILSITPTQAVVEAGVVWRDLLIATLAQGLTPPVLTDFLWLTVGGTLAVGGIGGTTFRHGLQVDNVLALDVITGEGELVTCSATVRADLFNAVLAGLGQVGIVVRATVRLVPAPARARLFRFFYPTIGALIEALRTVVADERFDNVSGVVLPNAAGGWHFMMEGVAYYTEPRTPADDVLTAGLGQLFVQSEDHTFWEYADRITGVIEMLKSFGIMEMAHPWCDLIVPGSQFSSFATSTFEGLTPQTYGAGMPIQIYPIRTDRLSRPMFRVPNEPVAFLFDLLRSSPDAATTATMIERNRALYERNRSLGGTFYPISAVPMSRQDWQRHFADAYGSLVSAKHRYDPSSVLTPGPGIF